MTSDEFNKLPMLLKRAQVLACGIPEKAIDAMRFEVKPGHEVPDGRLGAIRGLSGKARAGAGYYLYRKIDVARLCGFNVR